MKTNLDVVLEKYVRCNQTTLCLFCKYNNEKYECTKDWGCPTKEEQLEWLMQEARNLTNDEKVVLKSIHKVYKWIARDSCGCLNVYEQKPEKIGSTWINHGYYDHIRPFNNLFKFINWKDEEPYLIEELLKEEG